MADRASALLLLTLPMSYQLLPSVLYCHWPPLAALPSTSTPPRLAPLSRSVKRAPNRLATVAPLLMTASSSMAGRWAAMLVSAITGASLPPAMTKRRVWVALPPCPSEAVTVKSWLTLPVRGWMAALSGVKL